jgi:hypothetical protein
MAFVALYLFFLIFGGEIRISLSKSASVNLTEFPKLSKLFCHVYDICILSLTAFYFGFLPGFAVFVLYYLMFFHATLGWVLLSFFPFIKTVPAAHIVSLVELFLLVLFSISAIVFQIISILYGPYKGALPYLTTAYLVPSGIILVSGFILRKLFLLAHKTIHDES